MTGLDGRRVYLDWNATAPLRPEARAAMLEAMDAVGNPSSVHAEGRAAKAIVEKARGQVARLVGCEPGEVVFTSGATEAAALAVAQRAHWAGGFTALPTEHDCLTMWSDAAPVLRVGKDGGVHPPSGEAISLLEDGGLLVAFSPANGETGIMRCKFLADVIVRRMTGEVKINPVIVDLAQAAGKIRADLNAKRAPQEYAGSGPIRVRVGGVDSDDWAELDSDPGSLRHARALFSYALVSSHKLGGPVGAGAFVNMSGRETLPILRGGGQEQGRRSGTENVIGIAGFGAAAEAARRDLEAGVWNRVAKLRDDLEDRVASAAPNLHIFGKEVPRLPNTSCFAVPGWKGETQVMQMDLAGFAVSAGSACSSGKVNKASRVLLAMGFDEVTASSAIRVSMGPTTTEAEVMAFADTWIEHYRRRKERAA